jgi:integrase
MDDPHELTTYVAYCKAGGIKAGTIRLRLSYLRRVPNLVAATTDELVVWLAGHDWSAGTRENARSILSGFYRWLRRRGYRVDDPAEDLPRVRVPKTAPQPAPADVVSLAMLAGSDRERLMIGLGAWAGLRRAEIAAVGWADYAGGVLEVCGKGDRERVVVVSPALAELLDAELRRRLAGRYGSGFRYKPAASPYLFPGPGGGPVSPQTVGRVVGERLGGRWRPHSLRRRFATLAYRDAHDLFTLQLLMGHAKSETTARYVQLDPAAAAAAVLAASRLD